MSTVPTTDLLAFRAFLDEKLSNGGADLSQEAALDEWRELHPEPDDFEDDEDDVAAIQAALDDVDTGDIGISLEELDRELRREINFPRPPKK